MMLTPFKVKTQYTLHMTEFLMRMTIADICHYRHAKFCLFLAHLGYFVASVCTCLCTFTGRKNAVVTDIRYDNDYDDDAPVF